MSAMLVPGGYVENSPSALQVLGIVYGLLWCGSLGQLGPHVPLQMIPASGTCSPRAPPNDTSDNFSFHVKGVLVIELCFNICLNDGLGSFVGWPILIFSPSPLGSA